MKDYRSYLLIIPCMLILMASIAKADAAGVYAKLRPNTITVCSQNLERYGAYDVFMRLNAGDSALNFGEKEAALVERFRSAGCDVVAVQEVLGNTESEASKSISSLAAAVSAGTGRSYKGLVGDTNDSFIRCGFLFDAERLELKETISYRDDELPKLSPHQRPRFFARLPLEIRVSLKSTGARVPPELRLVTFHLKSKSGGMKDPAGALWETVRMESAEKLHEGLVARNPESFSSGGPVLLVLGDRNSDEKSASAAILRGSLTLSDFQGREPECSLSKTGSALCEGSSTRRDGELLESVLVSDPETGAEAGTHSYRKRTNWLDEILIPAQNLRPALEDPLRAGDYDSGIVAQPRSASDHALVWVRLHY